MSRRTTALEFDAITIEGGLLPPEWLGTIAALKAPQQAPADYGIPKGLNLRDELGRYWRIAQAHWSDYAAALGRAEDAHALAQRLALNLLRDVFGATDLAPHAAPVELAEHRYPVSASARGGRLPVVVAAADQALDVRDRRYGDAGRQRSAFGLLQEYLNVDDAALWGIATNGSLLRLARDNASLTRPAWIEADLARIFGEDRFPDFSLLWLLIHASRFGKPDVLPQHCPLEAWREASKEQGTRARDDLRRGVEASLVVLGQGFLAEPANQSLRNVLASGELDAHGYFQQLLRLVYRMIFLLTVEERGQLHPPGADPRAVQLYAEGYGLRRLRERARRRRAFDRHNDQWQSLLPVFAGLARGQPLLALPPLGGLFAIEQCPDLDTAVLGNNALLEAVFSLGWIGTGNSLARINWRDMGPEELGSVYECLLELVPVIGAGGHVFSFANADAARGNTRKTTGSYYTPDALVQELLDSALEPVIAQRVQGAANPEAALLAITVCDPACGSGHFLLGAARRLATHLAQWRAQGTPTGEDFRHALRDVITHSIYGVDRNPMAIELARMALWLEAMTPDRPLGFLDHHLQVGDALLGLADLAVLEQGIPGDAYKALSGDDKAACKALAKQNAVEIRDVVRKRAAQSFGQRDLLGLRMAGLDQLQALEALPDTTLAEIAAKHHAWQAFADAVADSPLRHAADLWLGAFLLAKTAASQHAVPTTGNVVLELLGEHAAPGQAEKREAARTVCREARVLHWPLAFPLIHASGGFACVLANPPWERIKLQEEEFFASRHADVAQAKSKAERSQRIQWLAEGMLAAHLAPEAGHSEIQAQAEQRLYAEFIAARREAEAASVFAHVDGKDGGRYPLTGVGDVNTYALFAETISRLAASAGRAGFIVPTGISTDDSTKAFFADITQRGRLVSLYDIENREAIFPSVHRSYKFCLLTLGAAARAEFICFAAQVADLADPRRRFTLTPDEFRLINPNTLTCPIFRSERDAELTKKLYRSNVVLRVVERNPASNESWGVVLRRMFDKSTDSKLFIATDQVGDEEGFLPLYEGGLGHQFNCRYAEFRDGTERESALELLSDPYYFPVTEWSILGSDFSKKCESMKLDELAKCKTAFLGFRRVSRNTDERTVIACIYPWMPATYGWILTLGIDVQRMAILCAAYNSLVFDYLLRTALSQPSIPQGTFEQVALPPPGRYTEADFAFIIPRVLELTYTAYDLKPWADDLGYDGAPYDFDLDRRARLRAELDAYYAKLYGLSRDELLYILDPAEAMGADYPSETFRVLKNKEVRQFGTYRTRDWVLDAWDMLEAQPPMAIPVPQSARRTAPLPVYAAGTTPASVVEDWLVGLVCDVLALTGSCDDTRLQQTLTAALPAATPHADVLTGWLAPVEAGRLPQILSALRGRLGVPISAPLSIPNPQALAGVMGDHRTGSLAHALVEARRQREATLGEVMAGASPITQQNGLQKSG